jgi:hypothetical protein
MAKTPGQNEIELEPDAWNRFERAVDAVVKGGPQHRPTGAEPALIARQMAETVIPSTPAIVEALRQAGL